MSASDERKPQCPLQLTHENQLLSCKEGRCAWWTGQNCSVKSLAVSLDGLLQHSARRMKQECEKDASNTDK